MQTTVSTAPLPYIDTEHFFFYDTRNVITAGALAESLLGLEAIVKKSVLVINRLCETNIKDSEVLINAIEFGSYKENIVFRFLFGKGKAAEKKLDDLRVKLGLHNMDLKKLVGWIIAGSILYAAYKFAPSTPTPATIHIENSFNNMGQELGMTKEQVIDLFETAIRNPEDLKKQVSRMAHPGGVEHTGTMTFDHSESLSIPADVVNMIPPGYKKEDAEEPFKDFEHVQIVIRAIDLDRPANGWAGIITEISDRRLPVVLADGLEPGTVPAGKNIDADVTVLYKVGKNGNKEPKKIMLRKVHSK
ncbi:hypothetical protein [Prosthecobacter sp.]|jgi:hypothetical protein|uniref:hypothetical protein n=1 Tax=Prosthecobacter sp. TaxID=1965333 RepID=UPI0037C9070F